MRPRTYDDWQVDILRKYYPDGRWDKIEPVFPNKSRANIRAIARKYGITRVRDTVVSRDLTGNTYGRLTVISKKEGKYRVPKWVCECSCGNKAIVDTYALIKGTTKSCGCLKHAPARNAKDVSGQKFGLLTAVERLPQYIRGETYYRCICECGREKIASYSNLMGGHVKSCNRKFHTKDFSILHIELDKTKKIYTVYRHVAPNGKSYVGITRQEPKRRFQNGYGYHSQPAFSRAINKYGWDNFTHEVLESNLTEQEAFERETYYITKVYHSIAPNGYNSKEGGLNGRNLVTPIIQYYMDKPVNFFEGITEASKTLGIAQKTIRIHCGKENAINGYYFEQLDPIAPHNISADDLELISPEHYVMKEVIAEDTRNKVLARNKATAKAVNKYSLDGKYICTFPSLVEARNSIKDSDGGSIAAVVNPNRQGEVAYGYMWKYDTGNHSDIVPMRYKYKRAVVKIDKNSGRIIDEFESMTKAAKGLHIAQSKIKLICDTQQDSFEDFIIQYKFRY
jgi:hypothetical protein